jgi:hypothetical protein
MRINSTEAHMINILAWITTMVVSIVFVIRCREWSRGDLPGLPGPTMKYQVIGLFLAWMAAVLVYPGLSIAGAILSYFAYEVHVASNRIGEKTGY